MFVKEISSMENCCICQKEVKTVEVLVWNNSGTLRLNVCFEYYKKHGLEKIMVVIGL